jgi:hypothetical protein
MADPSPILGPRRPEFFGRVVSVQTRDLITLQGFPTAILFSGMSFVTTLPAPMIQFFPMITPGRTITLDPSHVFAPMITLSGMHPCLLIGTSRSVNRWLAERIRDPTPIRQLSSIMTSPPAEDAMNANCEMSTLSPMDIFSQPKRMTPVLMHTVPNFLHFRLYQRDRSLQKNLLVGVYTRKVTMHSSRNSARSI